MQKPPTVRPETVNLDFARLDEFMKMNDPTWAAVSRYCAVHQVFDLVRCKLLLGAMAEQLHTVTELHKTSTAKFGGQSIPFTEDEVEAYELGMKMLREARLKQTRIIPRSEDEHTKGENPV